MESKKDFIEKFKARTKSFALQSVKLYQQLPKTGEAKIIGYQMLKSATSVSANYRAASKSRSKAEFYSKMSIVVEEADETVFWLELIKDSEILSNPDLNNLIKESSEILKIVAKARKTASPDNNAKP